MNQTINSTNKAFVLEAFDVAFNKSDPSAYDHY